MRARRGKIGSARVARRLDHSGVGLQAIRKLEPGYVVLGVSELGLIGAAPKDFVVFTGCGVADHPYNKAYVAKKPMREHTGFRECVTEYLISRIGRMLPLRVAEGRLVRIERRGDAVPDVRFMSRYFLRPDESLLHGVELVAQCFGLEKGIVESELPRGDGERAFYTIDFVDDVLNDFAKDQEVYVRLRDGFARMIAFDALIGATDRHASNWGVIEHVQRQRAPRFAPVFDTARGLLHHFDDQGLRPHIATPQKTMQFIQKFAAGAHPLIGIPGRPRLDYFDLVKYMVTAHRAKYGKPVQSVINAFRPHEVSALLHREFSRLLHPIRLDLIDKVLRYRHQRLIDNCKRP